MRGIRAIGGPKHGEILGPPFQAPSFYMTYYPNNPAYAVECGYPVELTFDEIRYERTKLVTTISPALTIVEIVYLVSWLVGDDAAIRKAYNPLEGPREALRRA